LTKKDNYDILKEFFAKQRRKQHKRNTDRRERAEE